MAPIAKRRRIEDEVRRPKKKVRKFKKQIDYHSSSEDEDGPRPAPSASNSEPLGERGTAKAKQAAKAKPILKHSISAPAKKAAATMPTLSEDEDDEDDDMVDETAKNTALNMAPASESEDEDEAELAEPLSEDDDDAEGGAPLAPDSSADDTDEDEDDESDLESTTSSNAAAAKKKRNDPTAFATSISKILDTKLSTSKRSDPVLSRSKTAADANKTLADERLEQKARAQIRAERKSLLEKGRVRDVLGLETEGVETGKVLEEERRLKKTAQRGVVKLFNAVRAAQVKAESAQREAREQGMVGIGKREERVNEMSKQGFLDLISSGGKGATTATA